MRGGEDGGAQGQAWRRAAWVMASMGWTHTASEWQDLGKDGGLEGEQTSGATFLS